METIKCADDVEDTLVKWIKAVNADKRLEIEDTKLAAKAFWAMVGGAFFWPAVFSQSVNEQETSRLKKELINIFLAKYRTS